MFGKNAFKKNKTDQDVNKSAGANMVWWSSNNPSDQSWKENAVKQDFPSNGPVKIK